MKTLSSELAVLAAAVEARTAFIYRFTATAIPNGVWCYTSLPSPLVLNGERFESAAIAFDRAHKGAGGLEQNSFTITAPVVEPFLSFCGRRLNIRFDCVISEIFFQTDGTPVLDPVISGQMTGLKRDLTSISAEFKPLATFLSQKVPATLFSQLDQRIPYTTDFGLTAEQLAALSTDAVATAINGNRVTSTAAAAQDDGYYYNGYIAYQRHIGGRLVTIKIPITNNDKAAGIFTLQWEPTLLLTEGGQFTAYAGYDGSVAQSTTKFNNFLAGSGFLGFPTFSQSNWAMTGMDDCADVRGGCGAASICDPEALNADWPASYKVKLKSFSLIDLDNGIPQCAGSGIVNWQGLIYPHGGRSGFSVHGCYPRSGSYWGALENGQCRYGAWQNIGGYLACCDSVMVWKYPRSTTDVWHLHIYVLKSGSGTGLSYTPDDNTPQTNHMLMWSGTKVEGTSPAGRFNRTGGTAGAPEYIDIEAN
ncbi:MAG: hypothetical protein WA117_08425 [Verrucomicrobiia bacterium]